MQEGSSQRSGLLAAGWRLLQRELETLRIDCGAHAAYLHNAAGQLLLETGAKQGIEPAVLGMLVAGGLATAQEIANLLQEPEISSLHFYRGKAHEVYASALDQEHLLCLIVAKSAQHSRIGVVWLAIKRAGPRIRRLLDLLERAQLPDPRFPTGELQRALLQLWDEQVEEGGRRGSGSRSTAAPRQAGTDDRTTDQQELSGRGGPLRSYREALELGLLGDRGAKGEPGDG